jgi:four helix bundle suffix protein
MQHPNNQKSGLIPKHGGYRKLKTFQIAQLVYDLTFRFCDRYIDRRSRTHDQMVQAARSGVQNIAEGSQASATSKKFELKLTNVARASLEELRLDYQDFLRHRGLREWERGDARKDDLVARRPATADDVAAWVAEMVTQGVEGGQLGHFGQRGQDRSTLSKMSKLSKSSKESTEPTTPPTTRYSEAAANAAIVLINVASALLGRQINSLALNFESQGGFTERLYNSRRRAGH